MQSLSETTSFYFHSGITLAVQPYLVQRSAKSPLLQSTVGDTCRTVCAVAFTLKLKLTLTLTLTLTDTGGAVLTLTLGYRPGGELP